MGDIGDIVQSYGTDSLINISPLVENIREYHLRSGEHGQPLLKQVQQYPVADESTVGTGILKDSESEKLFGDKSQSVRRLLTERGYCRSLDEHHRVLTWKFRNISVDDFDLGISASSARSIHQAMDRMLWTPLPDSPGVRSFLEVLYEGKKGPINAVHKISDSDYWFRQGNLIIAFCFSGEPSPELISLIGLKLESIQNEKMQNYFHIIASFNADSTMWMNEKNRRRRFFEIIENLLNYTWRPFDMETCEVSIDAAGDEGLIASGTLRVDFTEDGQSIARFDGMERRFEFSEDSAREFVVNDVSLRAAEPTGRTSLLSLRLLSRTTGNVDPRRNMLTHRFVKLFIESVGKLIDVIMPVIRREEALGNLRWQSFLDTLRLQSLEFGEDLHRILTESLRVLQRFFGISEIKVFSEDREIGHMLDLFSRKDISEKAYAILENPLSPADILRRQLLVFPIREIQGGRILLYFEIPRAGNRPLNPEIPDQYLMGTDLWHGVNEEAAILEIPELKDYLFFMVTECLTSNPKAVIDNLNRRLPVRGNTANVEDLMKLSRKILTRYARFFDLFGTLSGNMESGLAYMRGRRDNLTGLYNRQHFSAKVNEFFLKPGYRFGLMFIDMDNFKIFNDAVSHDFGDKLLISLANRMIEAADGIDQAQPGRFGGDEFCFAIGGIDKNEFEQASIEVFRKITEQPLVVSFFFDDRPEGEGMEINLIAFLHRLMRPDVGSRQASRTEYIEKPHVSPKRHVLDVWKHYQTRAERTLQSSTVKSDQVIDDVTAEIEDKILYNKIFPEIDPQLHQIIRNFISLQIRDFTTNRIRDYLISDIGSLSVERELSLKVSAGLAHSAEDRLRSMESLFKMADSRAYLAKHNGRNCMFGVDGQQIR